MTYIYKLICCVIAIAILLLVILQMWSIVDISEETFVKIVFTAGICGLIVLIVGIVLGHGEKKIIDKY